MATNECLQLYVKAIRALGRENPTTKELADVEARIIERQTKLTQDGLSIDSIEPTSGKTYGDIYVDDEIRRFLLKNYLEDNPVNESTKTWTNTIRDINQLKNEIKKAYPKYNDATASMIAINSTLVDTNFTFNTKNLESIIIAEKQTTHGDFYNRVEKELTDFDLDSAFKNKEFVDAFINEYIRMMDLDQWPTAKLTKLPSSSKEAHAVARAFVEEAVQNPNLKMIALGREDKRAFTQGLRVEFTSGRLRETFKDSAEFADFMLEHLKTEKYADRLGGMNNVRSMFNEIYDKFMTDNTFSWRKIDDFIKEYERGQLNWDLRYKLNGLEYRDGAAFITVNERAGFHQDIANLVLNTMQYNSQLVGFTKFFGHNWKNGWDELVALSERARNNLPGGISEVKTLRAENQAIMSWVESRLFPDIMERSNVVPTFSVLRRIQAGAKLGTAVITSMLDVPVFIFTGQRFFGQSLTDLIGAVFNVRPQIYNNRKEQLKFASYMLDFSESWLDAARDRFGINDVSFLNPKNMSKRFRNINDGASFFANSIFRLSGLNAWTRNLQAGAAGMYVKQFGKLIDEGLTFDKLDARFQAQLRKYRFDENDWNKLLELHNISKKMDNLGVLDQNKRLDLYKLGRLEKETLGKFAPGVDDIDHIIRDKLVNAVSDAVNTMVIKPGQFDRLATAMFRGVGTAESEIAKTIFQFKTQPISYFRKVYLRHWHRNLLQQAGVPKNQITRWHYLGDATYLIIAMMTMSAIQLQLKQYVAGRKTYDITNPQFWIEVTQQAGILGILQDTFMDMGGKSILQQLASDEKEPIQSSAERYDRMLGPLLADIQKLIQGQEEVVGGLIRQTKELDEGQLTNKGLTKIFGLMANWSGVKNLIWTKMLWRKYMSEHLYEWWNPQGAQASQRRLQQEADKNRGGEINNWLFEKLP